MRPVTCAYGIISNYLFARVTSIRSLTSLFLILPSFRNLLKYKLSPPSLSQEGGGSTCVPLESIQNTREGFERYFQTGDMIQILTAKKTQLKALLVPGDSAKLQVDHSKI